MTNANTITGTVVAVERIGATVYGNPTYRIALLRGATGEVGIYRISDDASLNFTITNQSYRKVPHVFALTRAGRISHSVGAAE